MTQGGTRAERKRHTRTLIIDSARGFVADRGFSALALREIARAAGIVPTAFYRHFESLDDLAAELTVTAADAFRRVITALEDLGSAPPWEAWPPVLAEAGERDGQTWVVFVRALVEGERPAGRAAFEAGTEARRRLAIVLSRLSHFDDRSPGEIDVLADVVVAEVVRVLYTVASAHREGSPGAAADASRRSEERLRVICGAGPV